MDSVPYPAPAGYQWVFCTHYRNAKTGKIMRAAEYGRKAWLFLVRSKKK